MVLNQIYNNSIIDKTKQWLFAPQETKTPSKGVLSRISHTTQKIKGMASSYGHRALQSGAILQLAESTINTCFPQLTVAYSLASTAVGLISQDPQTEEPKKEEEKKILKIKGRLLVGCIALSGVVSQALSYGIFDASYAQPLFTLMLGHLGSVIITTKNIPDKVFLGGNKGGIKDSILFRAFQRELSALSVKSLNHITGIQGNFLFNTILPYAVKNYMFYINPFFSKDKGVNYQDAGEIFKLYYPAATLSHQLPPSIQQFPPLKKLISYVLEIGIEKKVAMNILTRLFNDYCLLLTEKPLQMAMEKLKQAEGAEKERASHQLGLLIESTINAKSQWADKLLWSHMKSHLPSLKKEELDEWMRTVLPQQIHPKMVMDQDITVHCINHFMEFAIHQVRGKLFNKAYQNELQDAEIHLLYKNLNGLLFMKMGHVPFTSALIGGVLSLTKNLISKEVTRFLDLKETLSKGNEPLKELESLKVHSFKHEEKGASVANTFLTQVTNFMKRLRLSIPKKEWLTLSFYSAKIRMLLAKGVYLMHIVQFKIKEQLEKILASRLIKKQPSERGENVKDQSVKSQELYKEKSVIKGRLMSIQGESSMLKRYLKKDL
ncbi:hypothetical protein [Rhabdochlamydiaceae symbiont of Dictyostelium giganteum]|uniref:hypothetical protein n=1 Tax=Rhabdochlamydiaceae symbiont of Dictyostelium giganteum TaxID=3342349 RepID=UPI00384D628A